MAARNAQGRGITRFPAYDPGVDTDVLIPLKRLDAAKTRLRSALSGAERRRLMASMLKGVVRAALAADVGRVALASSDPGAPALAAGLGIGCVSDGGLAWNPGLVYARAALAAPAAAVLYLAGDLPLLEAGDVATLVAAGGEATAVIGRAHDGGTNALWVSPASALDPAFGTRGSAGVHAAAAAAAGLRPVILDRPGVAHDVDTAADLALARRLLAGRCPA
jgi:2-phospho-L-lactate/phosphoenolpyruvate guanylyltransferase